MKLVHFELKKIFKQRKFFWLAIIIFIYVCVIFIQNYIQQDTLAERAREEVLSFEGEINSIQSELQRESISNPSNNLVSKQLEYSKEMKAAIFNWKTSIHNEKWDETPTYRAEFFSNLTEFVESGGEFEFVSALEINKQYDLNLWLLEYGLAFEDENYPISPHLLLKENTSVLLGLAGIIIIILLFGNILTKEYESNTILTIKTQNIAKWKIIFSKYIAINIVTVVFIIIVVIVSIILPLIFGAKLEGLYPQLLVSDETYIIISTIYYILRVILLFISANAIIVSVLFLLSIIFKRTFIAIMTTGFILCIGYINTDMISILQTPLNPFYLLFFNDILLEIPKNKDWIILISAFFWSLSLLFLAIQISDKGKTEIFPIEKKPFSNGKTQRNPSLLWGNIKFELRKISRKGLLVQSLIILLIMIIIISYGFSKEASQKEANYLYTLNKEKDDLENIIIPHFEGVLTELKDNLRGDGESEEIKGSAGKDKIINEIEATIILEKEKLAKLKYAIDSYAKDIYKPMYDYQLFILQFSNGEFESGNVVGDSIRNQIGQFTMDVSIMEKEFLKERDIQPVFPGEYVLNTQLTWKQEQINYTKEEWIEENEKVDSSGLYSLLLYFKKYYYYTLIILLFLLGAGYSDELGKIKTLNFLLTQPNSIRKLYIVKIISASLVTIISMLVLLCIIIFTGTMFDRFGDWQYPILYYDSVKSTNSSGYEGYTPVGWSTGFHFISLGKYLVETILLFVSIMIFVIVLSIFLSIFLKNKFSVFSATILLLILGYNICVTYLSEISHLIPFTYFNTAKVANGELNLILDNSNITTATGCYILIFFTFIMTLFGYIFLTLKSRKKDYIFGE
ncbi:ABC transporter permease subunit [Bacillus sp. BGMRC 2118]|nr:ABC transporter permease subunit [Bacillus sp. BGMRC 2118]